MAWLAREPERRLDPGRVVAGARSVVCVAQSYFVSEPPAGLWNDPMRGRVARYAWGADYHRVMEPRVRELGAWIEREAGTPVSWRAYVDTGPVLERDVAARAGLGFTGKNTLLIAPTFGSYLLLAEIVTTLPLEPDVPASDGGAALGAASCGGCTRCQAKCPTNAFPTPWVLDANRCISYLTIEHRGAIAEELRAKMGSWVFGCDECQEVCPWVRQFSAPSRRPFHAFDAERFAPDLARLVTISEDEFRERYRGSPVLRTKRNGLVRNACIALGNSGNGNAIPALEEVARDPDPVIRESADWAIRRLRTD